MVLNPRAEPVPITIDLDGVACIGGTRVTLDTLRNAFINGATAEEIVQRYPVLTLADVYHVIAYYLRERDAVEAYIAEREKQAAEVRRENEARFDPEGVRDRLMARLQKQG